MIELMPHQEKAVKELKNGSILWGGVGSGKSATAIGYYLQCEAPRDIYIITTAKKRDSLDWESEAIRFGIGRDPVPSIAGVLTVDSWNNIQNYTHIQDAFFIFDEQRVVGTGKWVKAFIKIARKNRWILLSATPGDTWLDYAPIFVANGFYKNITEFKWAHVLYEPYVKFPKVKGYLNEHKLELIRNDILVEMKFVRHTKRYLNWLETDYDKDIFKLITKNRWNPYKEEPVKDVAEMYRLGRRLTAEDPSRLNMVKKLMMCHDRMIIFYNFNYELEMLRTLSDEIDIYEYNGHKKDPLPDEGRCLYLVQYIAGAEGWNCTTVDGMIMYSMTYSYKNFEQAQGRIDRLDTPFTDLYYYVLLTNSFIDVGIKSSLMDKKSFNERKFATERGDFESFISVVDEEA